MYEYERKCTCTECIATVSLCQDGSKTTPAGKLAHLRKLTDADDIRFSQKKLFSFSSNVIAYHMARVRRPFVTFGFAIGRQEYLLPLFVLCLFPAGQPPLGQSQFLPWQERLSTRLLVPQPLSCWPYLALSTLHQQSHKASSSYPINCERTKHLEWISIGPGLLFSHCISQIRKESAGQTKSGRK